MSEGSAPAHGSVRHDTESRGVVTPVARWFLIAAAIVAAVVIVVAFMISPSDLNVGWGVGLGLSGIALAAFATSPRRRFVAPIVFTVFYLLGYLIAFSGIVRNSDDRREASSRVGRFLFTDESFVPVAAFITVSLLAIVASVLLLERLLPRTSAANDSQYSLRISAVTIGIGWAVLSVGLIGTCAVLGLGRTGLNGETVLPFGLGGLLVYLRSYFLPPIGLFVIEASARSRSRPLLFGVLVLLMLFASAGAIAAISRGYLVLAMAPPFVLLLRRDATARWFRVQATPVLLVCVVASGAVVTTIGSLREVGYTSGRISMSDTADAMRQGSGDKHSGFDTFVALATDRVGGMAELVAVSTSRIRGADAFYGLVFGDEHWTDAIALDALGYRSRTDRTVAFGVGYGLFGTLAVADSLPFQFLGIALVFMLPLLVEAAFGSIAQRTLGQLLSGVLVLTVWGGLSTFVLERFAFVVLLTFVTVLLLAKPGEPTPDEGADPQTPRGVTAVNRKGPTALKV